MLGERIKQARTASGLSLRGLADHAHISAMAVSKYENNKSVPSSGVLLALAEALNVRVEYFFRPMKVELKNVEYRKHSRLPKKILKQIEGDVIEQIERYLALEEILPVSPIQTFQLPSDFISKINDYDEIELVAAQLRKKWGLGVNPILDLAGTLEERGIKIFQSNELHDGKFDGLAASVNGVPVIVIGGDWPGDRQRFTMAHELGHLVLQDRLNAKLDEEKAANRFAGAFIVPDSEVYKELARKRTWLEPRELCVLKKAYGLSMAGWNHRAKDLGILNDVNYLRLVKYFRSHGWHKVEPCDEYPREEPQLFIQLVFHALAEDFISESKAAELMGISLTKFRGIRKVDHGQKAINQ